MCTGCLGVVPEQGVECRSEAREHPKVPDYWILTLRDRDPVDTGSQGAGACARDKPRALGVCVDGAPVLGQPGVALQGPRCLRARTNWDLSRPGGGGGGLA